MKIWGVYKNEQVGDIDYIVSENLIVCFEQEKDARAYAKTHNKPFVANGESDGDELVVRPVTFVPAGNYDPTNNYGLASNENEGPAFICECGHATVTPFENLRTEQEEIKENNVVVGVRVYLPFTCSRCGKTQLAVNEVLMFDSADETIRCQIANMNYNLESYIYDPSSRVREIVARKGYGHDVFVANPDEHPSVLRTIAKQGTYLDILKNHPDKSVSSTANKALKKMANNP